MGLVSSPPPADSADVASPCFDLTGSVLAVLKRCGKGNCEKAAVSSWGDQVWLRYLVQGDQLFCHGQSGGTAFEGGLSMA